jgi:cytochrome c oxidase subunit 4
MSDHAIEQVHVGGHGHAAEEAHHPTAQVYMVIAAILTVLTVMEIGVYYVSFLQALLVPLLLVLSFFKFYLVASYYMHLRFDSRVYAVLFVFPLTLAVLILLSLIFLLGGLSQRPGP